MSFLYWEKSAKNYRFIYSSLLFLSLLFSTVNIIPPVYAQSANGDIEEIVVTVERREQNLQDLAGTAMVIQGEDLKLLGITNVNQLDGNIPGLSVANNAGNIEVYIRGIGSSNNTELGDPAAATHLDGVYVPRPSGFGAAFFDIERVEINIGPQGTLRGRNATAGSINVLPFKPGIGVFNGMFETSFGNYGEIRAEGMVNTPITKNSALRVAGFLLGHDSYYTNANPPDATGTGIPTAKGIDVAEAADDAGIRATYLVDGLGNVHEKLDSLRLTLTFDYIEQKGTGYTGTNYASLLGAGLDPDSVDDPRKVYVRPITPVEDTEHWGIKGQLDYSTDWFDIEYIASHRDLVYDYRWGGAADTVAYPGALDTRLVEGSNQDEFDFDNFNRQHQITDSESGIHEIRFFSETVGDIPLQWTAGAFFFEESQRTFLGGIGDKNEFYYGNEFNQTTNTDSNSFYTDMTYSVTDRFRLTGGARYTKDEKERTGVNIRYEQRYIAGNNTFDNSRVTPRIGTEGFELKALGRTIINPDSDGDGELTTAEQLAFYRDGIASFGARDTLDDMFNFLGADGNLGFEANNANNRPTCASLINSGLLPADFDCPVAGGLFGLATANDAGRISYLAQEKAILIAPQNGSLDNNFIDWRIRPEFDITEDNLVYGLVATGHKSGGFNDNVPNVTTTITPSATPGQPPNTATTVAFDGKGTAPTYNEEKVTLYEIGSKNEFDLHGLFNESIGARFNVSAFYYDYKDLQVTNLVSTAQIIDFAGIDFNDPASQALLSDAGDNIVSFTFNASDAEIYGAQFDGGLQLPNNINFDYSFLWLAEAKIKQSRTVQDSRFEFSSQYGTPASPGFDPGQFRGANPCLPKPPNANAPNAICNAREQSIEGNRMPRTPEFQLNASLSKVFPVSVGAFDAIISAGYRSSQYMTIFNGRVYNDNLTELEKRRLNDEVAGYWSFDVGSGYTYDNGEQEVRAEAYISNLTDEKQPQAIIITQRDNTRFFSRPRTFGLRLRVLF